MTHPAEQRAHDLLSLTRKLADVMAEETALLKGRRIAEAGALAEEKTRLALIYTREMKDVARDPGLLGAAPKPLLRELKDAAARLKLVLAEHERLLARLRHVSEGLVKAIADEVAARRRPATGYTAKATYAAPARAGTGPAIAHNSVV